MRGGQRSGTPNPCLTCPLPACEESDPGCAWAAAERARKRVGGAARVRRYKQRHPLKYHLAQVLWSREQRIARAAARILGRAA